MKGKQNKKKIVLIISICFISLIIMNIYLSGCRNWRSIDENRRIQRLKEEKEYKIQREEYIRNQKPPAYYLSLLKQEQLHFVTIINYSDHFKDINILYQLSIENDLPVLRRIDSIKGEIIILDEIILDEYFINDDPRNWHTPFGGLYDFAFATRSSWNPDRMEPYIKFHTQDGKTNISAYIGYYHKTYRNHTIEEILKIMSEESFDQIQYTGVYEYETIEILRNTITPDYQFIGQNYLSNPAKKLYIIFTEIGNLYMYAFDEDGTIIEDYKRMFRIQEHDNPKIPGIAADGGGIGTHEWFDFKDDYLIHNFHHGGHDEIIEFIIHYRKIANGT